MTDASERVRAAEVKRKCSKRISSFMMIVTGVTGDR